MKKGLLILIFGVVVVVPLMVSLLSSISSLGADDKPGIKGIAFVAFRKKDKKGEIWIMNGDGTNPRRLTNNKNRDDNCPSWSPDGSKIAFVSDTNKGRYLYVMDADGKNQRKLTPIEVPLRPAAWSPDSKRIVFTFHDYKVEPITKVNRDIYTINVDGTNLKRLTKHKGCDTRPSWSPDGKKITFLSSRNAKRTKSGWSTGCDIYVMDADGQNMKRLTLNMNIALFAWSPDGRKIAFSSSIREWKSDIYVMDADGKNIRNLTKGKDVKASHFIWSPNGKMIAFESGSRLFEGQNICVINADGTNLRNLTPKFYGMTPTWSPDSKWIAFYSGIWNLKQGRAIRDDIYRIAPNGKGLKKLIQSTKEYLYTYPAWSPVK